MERERKAFTCAFKACAELQDFVTNEKRAAAIMWLAIAMMHLANADEDKTSLDMVLQATERIGRQ